MRKHVSRIIRGVFSQMVIVGLLLVLQVFFIVATIARLSEFYAYIYTALTVLSFFVVLHVINKPGSSSGKIAWVVPIMVFPLFGGLFYLIVYGQRHPRDFAKKIENTVRRTAQYSVQSVKVAQGLAEAEPGSTRMVPYMNKHAGACVRKNSGVVYYKIGEDMEAAMLEAIEKAEKYVFLEFFIIKPGLFWDTMRELLVRKAAQGVDVRLMYDGMGCLAHLPYHYERKLEKMGINARVFGPFTPFLSVMQNNRDHRKVAAIDGHTAFCGGINLADEYINHTAPYGHWKDTGVKVTGDAAFDFTMMFLRMWELLGDDREDYDAFLPQERPQLQSGGFVMAYGDSPLDGEKVSEYMYMTAINSARRYLHIMTPYLILDDAMISGLCSAAKSDVDVKIIVPARSDHWYAHAVAKAYYKELTLGGVRIYEYSPGFIHAKSFAWDDTNAIVGTINLDYRSLYLHFECAAWMRDVPAVADISRDFDETLKKCREITPEDCEVRNPVKKVLYSILRIFAPLM